MLTQSKQINENIITRGTAIESFLMSTLKVLFNSQPTPFPVYLFSWTLFYWPAY